MAVTRFDGMKSGAMKALRVFIGLLLLPCGFAISRAVYFLLAATGRSGESFGSIFCLAAGTGLCLWALVFVFMPAPVKSYVLAHELTHALWGHLMGAALLGLKVSKRGGNVKLSESNFLVVLAPYFFPLYALLVICAYFLGSVFVDLHKYDALFYALVGFTLGFHIFFTVMVLARKQPDIKNYGKIFSYTLIYFMNALVISLLIVAVAPVTFNQFTARVAADFTFTGLCVWKLMMWGLI